MFNLQIHDFRPGADALEYYVEGNESKLVASAELPGVEFWLEATGEFVVEDENGRRYEGSAPREVIEKIRSGEIEPLLSPWFALRRAEGNIVDDVELLDRLPGGTDELRGLFEEAASGQRGFPACRS